jgi:glycosyltransferase involved in cell wall biosynthesis
MKPSLRSLHLWIPELAGPGGIQAQARSLVQACITILPESALAVVVKNGPVPSCERNLEYCSSGHLSPGLRAPAFAALALHAMLRRAPELVIVTHLHLAPLAAWLQRFFRFRYWVVAHGIEARFPLSQPRLHALRRAEKVLAVSDHTARLLRASLGAGSRVTEILPNTVDETHFMPGPKPMHLLRRYGLSESDRLLLTVARLDPNERYKGCDLVLEAMALLRGEVTGLRYLIVGPGEDSTRLRRRARDLGLEKQVLLTGFLPERELRDHYNLCDLFVMPSRAEGFGIVFLEALACGRAVVAGNSDGASAPLLHGKLGRLVDPDDPAELARTILHLLRGAPAPQFQPERLRQVALDHFGRIAFRRRLSALLAGEPCAA